MTAPRGASLGVGFESCRRGAAPDDEVASLALNGLHQVSVASRMNQAVAGWNLDGDLFFWPVVFLPMECTPSAHEHHTTS